MKNIMILSLVIAAAATTTYAQKNKDRDPRSRFYVGPKAGYNFANVYDTQGENFDADGRVGFVGGVFFTIPIGTFIGIQPEILFSQKGFQATGTLLGSPYALSRTTNYIDLPVLFSVKPSRVISLLAGPQFSYLLRQKDVFESNTINTAQVQEFENDNIRKNTLCFLGGIDFNFNHFVLGTRVGWDILNNHGDGSSATPRYKNAWLQATAAYRLY
jgi:hypothetical protein